MSGPRMSDTLLVVAGEMRRRFRFTVTVDVPYPMQVALDAMCPAAVVRTQTGPPAAGATGWFFNLDAKNVQLSQISGLMTEPRSSTEPWEAVDEAAAQLGDGFAVRLRETGRAVSSTPALLLADANLGAKTGLSGSHHLLFGDRRRSGGRGDEPS